MTDERPAVLIAEDEPIASMALRAQLEALDYTVVAAARDGAEALAIGRCFPLDLAVLDQLMPRLLGLEAAVELFRDAPTPVLLLTGFSGGDLPDPVPRPPVFATLTKPVGLADLRAGLDQTSAGFRQWVEGDPDADRAVRQSRDDRTLIGRAVRRMAGEGSLADAAAAFLERARQEGRSAVELARDLVEDPA